MRPRIEIGLFAAVLAAVAIPAPARADEIVGVLDLEIEGVSTTAAEKFESSIEDGLVGTGFKVSPQKTLRKLLEQSSYIDGCYFGPCLQEVYRNTRVKKVLVARITSLGPSYSFVVSLVDTQTGLPVSQVANLCEVCTLEEAIATATLAVIELVTRSDQPAPPVEVERPAAGEVEKHADAAIARRKKLVRRAALFFLSAGVVAGGAGAYLLWDGKESAGRPAAAAGGALALTGVTFLVISGRF